jgi:hypothetical protein
VLVKFRSPVAPVAAWRDAYRDGLQTFERRLRIQSQSIS